MEKNINVQNGEGVGMITQRLGRQSLEEDRPPHLLKDDNHDSGTESDKENSESDSRQMLPAVGAFQGLMNPSSHPLMVFAPNFSSASPVISVAKRPFQPLNQSQSTSQLSPWQQERMNQSDCYKTKAQEFESPQGSYDYESRGSYMSDFTLPSCVSNSMDMDGYSSEDELSSINCENSGLRLGGKRTWSKVNCMSDASSSGIWDSLSDEGVNDEASPMPLNFSSSPPKGMSRLSNTPMSPKLFLASVLPPHSTLCSVTTAWKKPR